MPQNIYDQVSRYTAKLDPTGFLAWLLGKPSDELTFKRWLDTRRVTFPGEPDRTSDTVAFLTNPAEHGVPWIVAIEFQIKPDPLMFGRLGKYIFGLWEEVWPDEERGSRFEIGGAVVNLTGNGTASRRMRWPGTKLETVLQGPELNLEYESADELLAHIESGERPRTLLPWVPLMASTDDAIVDRWVRLALAEPNPRLRAEYGSLAKVFAEKSPRKEQWHEQLEEWNVEESPTVNEWIAKGEVKGEARGKAIGEAYGSLRAARSLLLDIAQERFGAPTPTVEASILAISDYDRLARLVKRVHHVADWKELLASP